MAKTIPFRIFGTYKTNRYLLPDMTQPCKYSLTAPHSRPASALDLAGFLTK